MASDAECGEKTGTSRGNMTFWGEWVGDSLAVYSRLVITERWLLIYSLVWVRSWWTYVRTRLVSIQHLGLWGRKIQRGTVHPPIHSASFNLLKDNFLWKTIGSSEIQSSKRISR